MKFQSKRSTDIDEYVCNTDFVHRWEHFLKDIGSACFEHCVRLWVEKKGLN